MALAVGLVVLVGWLLLKGGGDTPKTAPTDVKAAPATQPSTQPAPAQPAPASSRAPQRGKKPAGRPVPPLDESAFTKSDALMAEATAAYNRAMTEQQSPNQDKNVFFRELNTVKDKLDAIDEQLAPLTEWEEEANLGDWIVPAESQALMARVQDYVRRIDRLRSGVSKISKAR